MADVQPGNCGSPGRHPLVADRAEPCGCGCLVFWGSHGCDLPFGHEDELHACAPGLGCSTVRLLGPWRSDGPGWATAPAEVSHGDGRARDPVEAFTWDNRVVSRAGAADGS
jgi:hypothetical protein